MNGTTESVTYSAGPTTAPPELRLIHYNDVYHVDASSAEPVGGIARFQHLMNYYRNDESFRDQPKLITLFSGDAFNPSLESSVTKGNHMVPILNHIGTDAACVGNHDLDFGVTQFRHLAGQCNFPWLLANVLDPALGNGMPLGNAKPYTILESSNGIKIGVIGLVEREWLATINSLPPNLIYKSAHKTAEELVPLMRVEGAEMIVALTHQREPNDDKIAKSVPPGLIDLILGGHDHFYNHSLINGIHVLRSGTDFKQLSYIEARRPTSGDRRWDFHIVRRDVNKSLPEDPAAKQMANDLTAALKTKLDKPIGHTLSPLDARFRTVRLQESNIGNFVCDLMRHHYAGDCCIMASGTIRGDQIYPPGVLRLKDLLNCFPFEDPCIVIVVTGQDIVDALENSVSTYPALEGRFPQVSNISFTFDPSLPPNKRIAEPLQNVRVGKEFVKFEKTYKLVTRGYMGRGKDGFDSLLVESEGGRAEEIVSEENGILISMLLRQYFMSLKILGQWSKWGHHMDQHWKAVHAGLHDTHPVIEPSPKTPLPGATQNFDSLGISNSSKPLNGVRNKQQTSQYLDDSDDEEHTNEPPHVRTQVDEQERKLHIMRQVMNKWRRLAGIPHTQLCQNLHEGEFQADWTRAIAPRVEGRIKMVTAVS